MNNGNLLNTLLGVTSANPSVTKANVVKARAESTEKFQQTLEQMRPDVAARKPAARRESPTAERAEAPRPEAKPAIQRNSPQEASRPDTHTKARDAKDVANNSVEKPPEASAHTDAGEPVLDHRNEEQLVDSQNSVSVGETQAEEQERVGDIAITLDNLLMDGPALAGASETERVLQSPENLLNPDITQLMVSGGVSNGGDADSVLLSDDVTVDPSLAATNSLTPLAASNPASGQIAAGLAGTGCVLEAQAAVGQAATGALTTKLTDEVSLADADAEVDTLTGSDTDAGENPDFLLLNSKAALNKLAEASMTAATLDKHAPTADLAKASAVNPALETLTRLTEAQSPAARAFVVQTGVPVTVGTPQWSQAVGDKVLWLAAQNVSSAEIRLDPPELGPMQVKVSINQDQASVSFTSPHPAVREALDQQLGRLREMFSEQGLNLVNVDVSDKSFAQRERDQEESARNQGNAESDEDELTPVGITQALSMRLVDHYA